LVVGPSAASLRGRDGRRSSSPRIARPSTAFNAGNNPAQLLGISFEDFKKNLGVFKTNVGVFFINPAILDIVTNPTTGRLTTSKLKTGLLGISAPGTFGNFR